MEVIKKQKESLLNVVDSGKWKHSFGYISVEEKQ
jgi:hypothetical protein